MEQFFKNKNMVELLARRWKLFAVIGLLSILLSAIFSSESFITPLYKSFAIVYPSNLSHYSDESFTEQMLQILESDDLKFKMLKTFDLYKRYKIDPSSEYAEARVLKKIDDYISVDKTEYESVKIKVLDKDPKMAKIMVDSLIAFYNEKVATIHKQKYKEELDITANQLRFLTHKKDSLYKVLNQLRDSTRLYHPGDQIKGITKSFVSDRPEGKVLYKSLIKNGEYITHIEGLFGNYKKQWFDYKLHYEETLKEYQKNISYVHVVEKPYVLNKKVYPVRWLIVLFSLITTLVFSIIIVIVFESLKQKGS